MTTLVTIYALCDPDTNEIRYIGQTNQPDKRLRLQIFESVGNKSPKSKWINELVSQGKQPLFCVLHVVDSSVADEKEIDEIKSAKAAGINLLNVCVGANGGVAKQKAVRARNMRGNRIRYDNHNRPYLLTDD